jgi:S-adenosylmethionine synthetase
MAARSFTFTSESVTEGHPDKVADQVSDSVLDAVLKDDPYGRVACETLITTGLVVVAGEITTETYVDIPRLVRERITEIGYTRAKYGFDAETCGVIVAIDEQSPDIAPGRRLRLRGAARPERRRPARPDRRGRPGDDVRLRDERDRRADAAADHARAQARERLAEVRKATCCRTCGRTARRRSRPLRGRRARRQRPVEIERVLISTQHRDGLDVETLLKPDLLEHVVEPILPRRDLYDDGGSTPRTSSTCNPTGQVRDRRADGRHRPDRAQDHRRHVRRRRAARRRARSRARIRRRSTARRRTRRATWRRTSSRRASPTAARSRSRTRSASRTR